MFILKGMHRKSLEAAEHLKEDGCNSDHEETTSLRTDTSDTSATSGTTTGQQPTPAVSTPSGGTHSIPSGSNPPNQTSQHNPPPSDSKPTPENNQTHYEDPEVFRNNSIACLRAKAQEHSAKLLNHGLMLQVRSLANMTHAQSNCDANANNLNLHHPDIVNSDTNSSMF